MGVDATAGVVGARAERGGVADGVGRRRDGRALLAKAALRVWALAFAAAIPLVGVAQIALWIGRQHTPAPYTGLEAGMLAVEWSIWATLTPLIVGFVWKVPLSTARWLGGIALHGVASCILALTELAAFIVIARAMGGFSNTDFVGALWILLALWFPYAMLVYWVIAIAAHAVFESRRARDREVEAAVLREHLGAAQLAALRMQLHPHFLCNTLNTVAVFLREGRSEGAVRIVTGLGSLLHTALDRMDRDEIPLRDELDFVRRYLEIEQIRFCDRLEVSIRADPEDLAGLVPCMMLQPVVENAIRHGISRAPHAGRVSVRVRRENGHLGVRVEDDGPGPRAERSGTEGHGVGLSNLRSRLERLYGDEATLSLELADAGGAVVDISIPYREALAANGAANGKGALA